MPTTVLKAITLRQISKPLIEEWTGELRKPEPIPSDQAPLSYEDMAMRICHRFILSSLFRDGKVELMKLHEVLHRFLGDMDTLGFFDPTWEGAINDAWREICKTMVNNH